MKLGRDRSISIVLLAWNEEQALPELIREIEAFCEANSRLSACEIIVVDDGSTDETAQKAKSAARKLPLRIISHQTNLGYGAALSSGLSASTAEFSLLMDGDGQYSIADLERLERPALKQNAALVAGYRVQRADNVMRKINGKLWTIFMRFSVGHSLRDIDCGCKLFRNSSIDALLPLKSTGAFAWTELVHEIEAAGHLVSEIPVSHRARIAGEPTGNSPKVILRALKEWLQYFRAGSSKIEKSPISLRAANGD